MAAILRVGQELSPHASGRGLTATASPDTVPSGEDPGRSRPAVVKPGCDASGAEVSRSKEIS